MKRPALWKLLAAEKKELEFFNFNAIIIQLKHRHKETMDIFFKVDGHWDRVYTEYPKDTCACGREYNGFRLRYSPEYPKSIEDQLAWLHKPLLCMVCYYKNERAQGNWIPKDVAKILRLEN